MTDVYTKIILTLIGVVMIASVLQRQFTNRNIVQAQTGKAQQHCVWTYITDQGRPNLGENGIVDLHDVDWKKVSEEGWQLKAVGQNGLYMFERCE